jgi:hypothetical protein
MPSEPDEILNRRLQTEAERRGEPLEAVRDALLRRGLDGIEAERAIASDIVLVTATSTEHDELKRAAKELGLSFNKQPGRNYYRLGRVGENRVAAMRVSMGRSHPMVRRPAVSRPALKLGPGPSY